MPKIKKHRFSVSTETGDRSFEVDIHYEEEQFYVLIPDEFEETIAAMSKEHRNTNHIDYWRRGRNNGKYVVIGVSESELTKKASTAFHSLAESSISKKEIIFIEYKSTRREHARHIRNGRIQKIGVEFEYTYCTEVSVGQEKSYWLFTRDKSLWSNEEDRITREKISVSHGSKYTIIDDTPQNRAMVEDLYSRLDILIEKVCTFVGDREKLLNMIANNQKLIE